MFALQTCENCAAKSDLKLRIRKGRIRCSLSISLRKKSWELIGSNGYSKGSGLGRVRGGQKSSARTGVLTPEMPTRVSMLINTACGPKYEFTGLNYSAGECAPPPSPPPEIVIAGIPSAIGTLESVLEIVIPPMSTPSFA